MNAQGAPELAGPCGPAPWYIELADGDDPMQVVARLAREVLGPTLVVHSTSWRRDRGTVLLSFIVVMATHASDVEGVAIARAELARGGASSAPASVRAAAVIEHGLRHLAWLAQDDAVVRASLPDTWLALLSDYVPEPFRHLS